MNHDIPKIPDHIVEVGEDWPMGLAAYDNGFVILQPRPRQDWHTISSTEIGSWEFAAFIPGAIAKKLGELTQEKTGEQ